MSETCGIIIAVFIILSILIWIAIECYISSKIDDVLNHFRNDVKIFYKIAEGHFEIKTNGKKIKQWDNDHKIDYIINHNHHEIISNLKLYNELYVWWIHDMPKVKQSSFRYITCLASNMVFIGGIFQTKAQEQLKLLIDKYNPEKIKFRLETYTYYENGERHYNQSTYSYTYSGSSYKNVTFRAEIEPGEIYKRLQFLAKYNFTITRYQYECENQRSLMTKEVRLRIIRRDGGVCQNCGKKCTYSEIEIDHIQPISKGGKTIDSNLQVLCVKCNRQKSNKWLDSLYEETYNNIKTAECFNSIKGESEQTQFKTIKNKINENTDLKNIKWVSIISSSVKESYYNPQLLRLYIKFKNNSIYAYYNVDQKTYIDFLSAPSKGGFVRNELRKFNYSYIKLSEVQ